MKILRGADEVDVVVVGAGPNGLICANYLARAGLQVGVVEASARIGGGLSTEEVTLPLFKHNLHAFFMRWTPDYKLWSDLELDSTGLEMVLPERQNALPTSDGRVLVIYNDLEKTESAIAAFDRDDAKRFVDFLEEARRISRTVIEPLRFSAPLPAGEMEDLLRRSADGRSFLALSRYSALDLVRELFENEVVRALVLFASALRGYLPALDVPGTGYVVAQAVPGLIDCLMVRGGSYELARTLAGLVYRNGGWIRSGAPVVRVDVAGNRASGVTLSDGRRIKARRAVVSNVPAPMTLLDMVGREHLDASLATELDNYMWNGEALFGLHLALAGAPSFGDADDGAGALNLCLGYESSQDVERDLREVREGAIPSAAALHASVPTRFDPSQAPPGLHTAFGWQFVPSRPEGSDASYWSEDRCERQMRDMVETWVHYAPNVADAEIARAAHSPLDTQRAVPSMWLGDRHHGSYHPHNYWEGRPCRELSGYRTPVEGLFLCGATQHPGGSVNGLAGYNAAGDVLDDLGEDKWWKPVNAREALPGPD